MANQITIDIGAAANDGTGDPLRTAFNYVNNNFSNVWNTGLPNSNVQFLDNRILTVNTNANLVLAPNGVGKVASNVDIVPNTANVFALGGLTRRWNTIYGQYLDLSHNATIGGNLTVTGNLSAGNISYTSNVFVGDLEGSVFDGASSIVLDVIDSAIYVDNYRYANGSPVAFGGTPGGSNTQIQFNNAGSFGGSAAFTFNRASNVLTVSGNISAGNITVSNLTTTNTIYGTTGTFTGDQFSDGAMYVGSPAGTVLGSDVVIQITANAGGYSQTNFQNINSGGAASSDYILTADNGNDTTHYLDMGITSSGWDGSETNVLSGLTPNNGYLYVQDGNLTLGTRTGNTSYSWKFDTTGNLTVAGNIIPTGNNTQSLGSATQQWNDLYLSNATIYMNSVPIGLTSGNVLTVNGANVVTATAGGNIDVNNIVSGSNIAIDTSAEKVTVSVGASDWVFDETGVLTAPGEIETVGNIAGGNLSTTGNVIFPNNYVYSGNTFTSPETNGILKNFKWNFSDTVSGADTVTLQWNLLDTTFPQWYLSTDSQNVIYTFDGDAQSLGLFANNVNSGTVTFGNAANNGAGTGNDIELTTVTGDVYIRAGSDSWKFDNNGALTAPGNITTTGNISVGNILAQNIRTIEGTVYLGQGAGLTNQGTYAIAVGRFAGSQDQGGAGLAIGQLAGQTSQGVSAVALGLYAANDTQGANAVAIGTYAGRYTQGADGIAIGQLAGNSAQGSLSIAIGQLAGANAQGGGAVAVGYDAGQYSQGVLTTAIGAEAGRYYQSNTATAIGSRAGNWNQGAGAIAIGRSAAENISNTGSQGFNAIAIGNQAGYIAQGTGAISIGAYAGITYQGAYSIAIGQSAGRDPSGSAVQAIGNNSIIINASSGNLVGNTANAFYVNPVRNDVSNVGEIVFYNTVSKEITYGNTISIAGNISTNGYIAAGNIGVSTTITTQTLVTDPGPLSGLTTAWGARGFINDGNLVAAGNFGAQVSGGGGNSVPVWSDGANWYIG